MNLRLSLYSNLILFSKETQMRRELSERSDRIIALLSEEGALSAAELSERLAVSVQTIRADLRTLDDAALVQRRNGKVRLRQQSENIGYHPRTRMSRQEKQRIALAAKNLIPEGARVALGTGTTVEYCARFLGSHKNIYDFSMSCLTLHILISLQEDCRVRTYHPPLPREPYSP